MVPVLLFSLEERETIEWRQEFLRTDFLLPYQAVDFSHIVRDSFVRIDRVMDVEHLDTFPLDHGELHDEVIHLPEYKHDQW